MRPERRSMNFADYLSRNYENLIELSIEHVNLVLIAMLCATLAGIPLGILAHRSSLLRPAILGVSAFFLTIPSLALYLARPEQVAEDWLTDQGFLD